MANNSIWVWLTAYTWAFPVHCLSSKDFTLVEKKNPFWCLGLGVKAVGVFFHVQKKWEQILIQLHYSLCSLSSYHHFLLFVLYCGLILFSIFHSDISFPTFLSLPVSAWCHVYNHLNPAVLRPKILHSPQASHCYIFLSLAHLRSCSVTIRHRLIPNPLSPFRSSFPRVPIIPGLPADQMLSVIYYRTWQNWPTFKCHNRLLDTSHLSNFCSFFHILIWTQEFLVMRGSKSNKVELLIVVLYYSRPRLQQEGFYMTIFKCEHLDSGYTTEQVFFVYYFWSRLPSLICPVWSSVISRCCHAYHQ